MKRQMFVNLGNLLLALSEAVDLANPSISQHQQRTAFISLEIAKNFGVSQGVLENIFSAALLHDIGAISVEEKIAIHNMDSHNLNLQLHSRRGELLLEQTPWLNNISKIVGNHHKNWIDWDLAIKDPIVFSSQVILLADHIERHIDRNKYILHQHDDIIENAKLLRDIEVNGKIIDCFVDLSSREEFWLDMVSPRLYPILLYDGPYRNVEIGLDEILLVGHLFRDVIDFKSNFTATHTSGVAACAKKISELFGLSEIEVNLMKVAGNFHDVGKLIIPNSILEKPGKLTKQEYAIIKSHTYYSYYIINSIGGLQQIAEWAAYHHEKLDGNGYPFHCKNNELDTGSRIMAVSDIFTAISEDRPYREGMNKNSIYKTIKEQSDNGLLDSRIVDILFDNYEIISSYVSQKQIAAKEFYDKQFLAVINQTK